MHTTMSSPSTSSLSPACMSSAGLDDFALPNSRTQDVFQSIVKGRKSWKTLRGGEVVWPPELEAALIEGLEKYQPDDSRETRLLGRFPMRNRFISDYIYDKTGKRRTAKQVGSRLQQLRDTCGGKRLLNLLSPCRRQYRASESLSPDLYHHSSSSLYRSSTLRYDTESSSSDTSSPSSPTTPRDAHATLQHLLYRGVDGHPETAPQSVIFVDLLPPSVSSTDAQLYQCTPIDESAWLSRGTRVVRISQQPRHFRDIDPTVTLLSRSTTSAHSCFAIYCGDNVVFSEITQLHLMGPAPECPDTLMYKTQLVPGYWDELSKSPDLTQYTIMQRVIQDSEGESPSRVIFSAMYKFCYSSLFSNDYSAAAVSSQDLPRVAQPQSNTPLDFPIHCLLQSDSNGFADLINYEKPVGYYDLDTLMRADWDVISPPNSTPAGTPPRSQLNYGDEGDDELLSPSSSCFDPNVPRYVL